MSGGNGSRPEIGTTRVAHAAGRPGGVREAGRGAEGQQRSPYGRPMIKPPVWTWEIPTYFFTGGLGGSAAVMGHLAERSGNAALARRAWLVAAVATNVSPLLLVSDLGRPARFLNMLRVFKVTSPMSVGSWLLVVSGGASAVAGANAATGLLGPLARRAKPTAAVAGMPLATYTAALVANTSVPVWHRARHVLPFLFGASAVASGGAALTALTPIKPARPARRAAVAGGVAELVLTEVMERSLGDLRDSYSSGAGGLFGKAAKALTAAGTAAVAARAGESRQAARLGGALMLAGALSQRWSVFRAGFHSATTPDHTAEPQRRRIEEGKTQGALRVRQVNPGSERTGSPAIGV